MYSLFGGVQRSLPGRSQDALQHTCWSCEQSWEGLRSDLAAAAQMLSIFGVESSVNISLCCACSAFIRLLTPRASVFLRSSGGLHSVQPPLTPPPPPPRLHLTVLLNLTFTIRPSVAPAYAWVWLRVLKLLQTAEETARWLRTESSRPLPPLLTVSETEYIKIAENDNIAVIIMLFVVVFFSLLLPSHQSGFWNDVLLWITGGGRERVHTQQWKTYYFQPMRENTASKVTLLTWTGTLFFPTSVLGKQFL